MGRKTSLSLIAGIVFGVILLLLSECTIARANTLYNAAIGDSIAAGTGRALNVRTYARVGASSCYVLKHYPHVAFDRVVISAGINDAPGYCVRSLLASIRANRIVVILPAPINSARRNVMVAAVQYGAYPLSYSCKGGCTKRNFHPGSYATVAAAVRRLWWND